MILGFSLLIIGIITFFWFSSNYQKSRVDRPLIFNRAYFIILVPVFYILLILSGIALIFISSINIGLICLVILILLYLLLKLLSGRQFTKSTILGSYKKFKNYFPEESEKNILFRVIKSRHSDWPDDRINTLIEDIENINELVDLIMYIEHGRCR